MSKVKVVIDPGFGSSEKAEKLSMSVEEIIAQAGADWSPDDPGIGRAAIVKGREIFNPVPMAPPVGYIAAPSMFDQLYAKLRAELLQAKADEAVDTLETMNDFPEDDEPAFLTDYEIVMMDDFPSVPPELPPGAPPPAEEPVQGELEVIPPEKPPAKKKPPKEAAEAEEA